MKRAIDSAISSDETPKVTSSFFVWIDRRDGQNAGSYYHFLEFIPSKIANGIIAAIENGQLSVEQLLNALILLDGGYDEGYFLDRDEGNEDDRKKAARVTKFLNDTILPHVPEFTMGNTNSAFVHNLGKIHLSNTSAKDAPDPFRGNVYLLDWEYDRIDAFDIADGE